MPANKKPLKIFVRTWMQPDQNRTVHEFYARRFGFTAEQVRHAQIVEVPVKRYEVFKQSLPLPKNRLASPPFSQITFSHEKRELNYQQHFPYPEIFGKRAEGWAPSLTRGQGVERGMGDENIRLPDAKISPGNAVNQIAPSPQREKQFANSLVEGSSLAEHYAAFSRRSEKNRHKANYKDIGAGI